MYTSANFFLGEGRGGCLGCFLLGGRGGLFFRDVTYNDEDVAVNAASDRINRQLFVGTYCSSRITRITFNRNWLKATCACHNTLLLCCSNRGGMVGGPVRGGRGGFRGQGMRGRGRGMRGGRGRGRGGPREPGVSKEQLDNQLDEYMSKTKSYLDAELDTYMAEANP